MNNFYITLPASVDSYASNTSSQFVTRLPETLGLKKGLHVVGLSDLIFPYSHSNISADTSYTVRYVKKERPPVVIIVPRGHYSTSEKIESVLNQRPNPDLVGHQGDVNVTFKFHDVYEKFTLHIESADVKEVEMEADLAYFLGFNTRLATSTVAAENKIDYYNNISTVYIYSDIVDYSIVGNVKSNLLQCCPITGTYGMMIQHTFNPVRYLPIMHESIESIKIELLSEFGKPIHFAWGSTIVTLHIKTQ